MTNIVFALTSLFLKRSKSSFIILFYSFTQPKHRLGFGYHIFSNHPWDRATPYILTASSVSSYCLSGRCSDVSPFESFVWIDPHNGVAHDHSHYRCPCVSLSFLYRMKRYCKCIKYIKRSAQSTLRFYWILYWI